MMSENIDRAVQMITSQRGLQAEIVQKRWPAEGIVYVRLFTDDGREEWVLLDRERNYDAAYVSLQHAANRLRGGVSGLR